MRTSTTVVGALLGVGLAALPGSAVTPAPDQTLAPFGHIDEEPDCNQLPPERTPVPLAQGADALPLVVTVLVAQADLAKAQERLKATKDVLASAGIDLRTSFRVVSKRMPTFADAADRHRAGITFAKQQLGGTRPKGTDVVLFLNPQFDGTGFADCVGGIADASRAFAVAGLRERPSALNAADDGTVAAHEIGHLLGAQHHYGNCVEAQPGVFLNGNQDLSPCTLMFQFQISPKVGTLEGAYMRDYVRAFGQHVSRT